MLLAGDIGGTKTTLAIVSPEAGPRAPLAKATFPSAHYPSLEAIAQEFLAGHDYAVEWASFGVSGPVVQGEAKITNLPWVIQQRRLEQTLRLSRAHLLNDLAAIAHAVPFLGPGDLHTLSTGRPVPGGTIAVIAPGTGLGEAFLTWNGERYHAHPSEGGHTDFAPTTMRELELLRYLLGRFDHISYERVCSGFGLPNLYDFLKDVEQGQEPAWLAEALAAAPDRTPVIVTAALDGNRPCALCTDTLDLFVSILAAEAGNLALKMLATGGVYLAGGIPPRILVALQHERFMQAFNRKGRFAELIGNVPVHVILNPEVALLGAIHHGLEVEPD